MTTTTIPVSHRALAALGLALSAVALIVDILGSCGACGRSGWAHTIIAAMGAGGYLLLVVAGRLGRSRVFFTGVFAAAGVHSALLAWMTAGGSLCPICVAAGVAAVVNMGLALIRKAADRTLVERAYLPAVLVAGAACYVYLAADAVNEAERAAVLREDVTASRGASSQSGDAGLEITVYESERCRYCREFRDEYEPRLTHEFGGRLTVVYRPAAESGWVRRTPTIVAPDGPVFEGLPAYRQLRDELAHRLDRR